MCRRYPPICASGEKLRLDVNSMKIKAKAFFMALKKVVPASNRIVASPGQALSPIFKPLFENSVANILQAVQKTFLHAELALKKDRQQGITVASTSLKFCQSESLWFVQSAYRNLPDIVMVEFYYLHVRVFILGISGI